MSAKRKPSGSTRLRRSSGSWANDLAAITINEDHWRCNMTMIVETTPAHTRITRLFDETANGASRRAIYPLSFKQLMQSVRTLSRIDEDKCPAGQKVFHEANRLIERGERLEAWLVANLVKYLVHRAKVESTKRQTDDDEVDRAMMLATINVESQRSMRSAKTRESTRSLDVKATPKPNNHLRKRGEGQRDRLYIDDAPEGGPQMYVVLTGFRDPNLPLELIRAGLPLICVLKIKDQGSLAIGIPEDLRDNTQPEEIDTFGVSMDQVLSEFWVKFNRSINDHDNLEAYSNVIFRNFCPPQLRSNAEPGELETFAKDLYDRTSYVMYDLYDFQCLHADYIASMKIQRVPEEARGQPIVYAKIMNDVPEECSSVSVILQAMIAQLESDVQGEQPIESEFMAPPENPLDLETNKSSKTSSLRPSDDQRASGSSLNLGNHPYNHEIHHWSNNQRSSSHRPIKDLPSTPGPMIILECDRLRSRTYHVPLGDNVIKLISPKPSSLAELALRSLRDPRIFGLWSNRDPLPEKIMRINCLRINKMARCFSVPVDSERLHHYLHLRSFDKMIHGGLNGTFTAGDEDRVLAIAEKEVIPEATRFPMSSGSIQNDPSSRSGGNPISNLLASRSDSVIDYHVSRGDTAGFPASFNAPKNRRKTLLDLDASVWGGERRDASYLEEFIDVCPLSPGTLPQAIHQCLREYQDFRTGYLEITDTILLCFGDTSKKATSHEDNEENFGSPDPCPQRTFKIVSPICLRDFCRYVVHEEKDSVGNLKIFRSARGSTSAAELTRKLSDHTAIESPGVTTTFTEHDFVLPNSLKARTETPERLTAMKIDGPREKSEEHNETRKQMSLVKKRPSDESLTSTRSGKDSSMTVPNMSSLRSTLDDGSCKLQGYDLGNSRIQLTSLCESFASPDGTLVTVHLDQWLYGVKRLAIGIDQAGCFLKLQSIIADDSKRENLPFHLITENGIVMAFSKSHKAKEAANFEDETRSYRTFEFGASWPSGLSMKAVSGDRLENPFYIQQRYISKGPECWNVSTRESYRKFLRNGTVLKFLNGNEVEVLRPNGTIVRCHEYDKFPGGFGPRDSANFHKDEPSKPSTTKYPTRSKKKVSSPKTKTSKNLETIRKRSTVASSLDTNSGEMHSSGLDAARVKITRYTAVEHDGLRYEVENDEVSRVYDRSLVRTSTDVEAYEKFTRRDDGTRSILNSRGELSVSFPDGTVITTGYVIEDKPLYCDWNNDEFARFFGNDLSRGRNDEAIPSPSSSVSDTNQSESKQGMINPEERLATLLTDSFVSVLMTCRMEHERYATVAYDPLKTNCQLSMPDDVEIEVSQDGSLDVKIGRQTELSLRDDRLIFSSNMSNDHRSVSIYSLRDAKWNDERHEEDEVLLATKDSGGRNFHVKVDGSVSRESESDLVTKRHRLFAINRDWTGCEYVHKSKRDEYLGKINGNERSKLILVPVGADGLPEYRLFLRPLEPINYSTKWLQKVTRIRATVRGSSRFSRSTYADPYDWLFPFGRHSNEAKKSPRKPGESILDTTPLSLIVLKAIANPGDRFLRELEEVMARCRYTTSNVECALFDKESSTVPSRKQVEKWLNELALGIDGNIDSMRYLRGLSTRITDHKSGQALESLECRRRGTGKWNSLEPIRWYERCLRERIILPYFKSIQGSCFLWITSCVDEALRLVE